MPKLTRINIYPVKSFDAERVDEAVMLASGGLQHDRRFVLVDRAGDYVNGKRFPAVHRLRSHFNPVHDQLSVQVDGHGPHHTFDLRGDRAELAAWMSDYFGQPLSVAENTAGGFPDDTESPGPTLVSTATLALVASWFAGVTVDEARDRFRPNLEIDADEPFWEDRLLAAGPGVVRFQIGDAQLVGTNPCARCPVPTRNPTSGDVIHGFAKVFAQQRQASLPDWAPRDRFDHFYRLSVNTRPVHAREATLRVGDELTILGVE
ncbi:MAG: MOSC N-terminal beta barrel domain-containing protein [Pirellulales bacterium]